jgi:hypothetical protein
VKNFIYIQTLDEFNYTSSVNFFKREEGITSVICLPGFEILFYNFDKILISKTKFDKYILLSNDIKLKERSTYLLKKEASNYSNYILSQNDLETKSMHIYEFVFSSLAKDMAEKKECLYKPKKNDYEYVKQKFFNINKKIITINGRNLNGERSFRNNNLKNLIDFLIEKNYFVVNCTMPSPSFEKKYSPENYLEIPEEELCDYSKNISYFLNSDCLISVSDSGGITNHICTNSNLILYGRGGWVDNPDFGFNNKSLYDISKEIKPTYISDDFEEIDFLLKKMEKPKNISFFDENKIIY